MAAKEEGVKITIAEAQQVIDTIFKMYPRLLPFFEACQKRAIQQRWMCGCFGRFRRFPSARDRKTQSDLERQAMNFPIQNLVADAMNRAVDNLYCFRRDLPGGEDFNFDVLLQIHDALLFEVDYVHAGRLINSVIPQCMCREVPIYPCDLDGMPMPCDEPYYFGVDAEVALHWGEQMTPGECLDRAIDPALAGWLTVDGGYAHVHEPNVVVAA